MGIERRYRRSRPTGRILATIAVLVGGVFSPSVSLGASAGTLPAVATSSATLYVVETTGKLLPIDTATNAARFPIADVSGGSLAIGPDGGSAFVVDGFGYLLHPVSLPRGPVGQDIFTGVAFDSESTGPDESVAIAPDGKTAYLATKENGTLVPISLASYSALRPIKIGGCPISVAITPDGRTAYVADDDSGTVIPITTATSARGAPIRVGVGPQAIAITPDGKTVYVANSFSNTVTPISTVTKQPGVPIPVGAAPLGLAITPDGHTVYVANYNDDTVTPIATATNTPGTPIPVPGPAFDITVAPDGKTAYVTTTVLQTQPTQKHCLDGHTFPQGLVTADTVTPITTATNTAGLPVYTAANNGLPCEGCLGRLVISPDQAPVAKLSVTPEPAGSATPTRFDASRSLAPSSPIVSYQWDFGDGQTVTTTGPATTHSYARANTYKATVTETDAAGTSTTQVFTGHTMSRNGSPSAVAEGSVVIVSCTKTQTCAGSVSVPQSANTPAQTVGFAGKPTSSVGTVHLAVAPASVVCPAVDQSVAPVSELTDTGFSTAAQLAITTTLHGTVRASSHHVCYSSTIPFRSQTNPTVPSPGTALLLDCSKTANVAPCVVSTTQVGPDVIVRFVVPGGDPRFYVVAPRPLGSKIPTIPKGMRGLQYSAHFSTVGGVAPVQWNLASGKLPPGLTLDKRYGTVTGKPTTKGQFIFSVQARDAESPPETASLPCSIFVT